MRSSPRTGRRLRPSRAAALDDHGSLPAIAPATVRGLTHRLGAIGAGRRGPDRRSRSAIDAADPTRDGPVYAAGQCGATGLREPRICALTCVVPTGFEPVSPP